MMPVALAVAAGLFSGLCEAASRDDALVHWEGQAYAPSNLPDEVGEWPRKAINGWAAWASENGYVMHLEPEGRVLLILRSERRSERSMELIAKTIAAFDRTLPAPKSRADAVSPRPASGDGEQDTEGGVYWSWEFTDDGAPLDSQTAVLIQALDPPAYERALDHAATMNSYLAQWAPQGKKLTGFVFEQPLVAVWMEQPPGMEEWNIENELVHRLVHLLTWRRFSQLPYWLELGIAWFLEEDVCGGMYCFPYRSGFVWATEHSGWLERVRGGMKGHKDDLALEELCTLERGSYEETGALRAYGTARFVAQNFPPMQFSEVVEDLRKARNENGIRHRDDGTWERVVGFEVAASEQQAAFEKHTRSDFLAELTKAFKKGSKYKASPAKKKGAKNTKG